MNPPSREWLETDGRGGFASGPVEGPRTRRYHGLLTVALTPPTGRMVLVDGFDAWLEPGESRFLTLQRYAPDVVTRSTLPVPVFADLPWPTWTWQLGEGGTIQCDLFVSRGTATAALRWRATGLPPGTRLVVRPFLSGREMHALHVENESFDTRAETRGDRVRWQPYAALPAVLSHANASYRHDPVWYRRFALAEEAARGFDHLTDCLSPGVLCWDLDAGDAVWLLTAEGVPGVVPSGPEGVLAHYHAIRATELERRLLFPSRLHQSADDYLVQRGSGKTIIAGYPWFTDWGRDTFIALRGLCLSTGRLDDARDILLAWAGTVSEGMLPNRFVDRGDVPEFNAVDASLWYVIAAWEYLQQRPDNPARQQLEQAILAIVSGYAAGTRYGIRADPDGLLRCGERGVQLTWMDARVGDWVVTPRTGKPVEVQALWLNALAIAARIDPGWEAVRVRGHASFARRFWNEAAGCLYDVVDVDHIPGQVDDSIRPNQIFAVGGLPFPLLEGEPARRVVEAVRQRLLTPLGVRSLAPDDPAYVPVYQGGPLERDSAYHQGTVWPWLAGPFAEAWLRVEGDTPAVRARIRETLLQPLLDHLEQAGVGHISEIADAEPPHTPRGCPFQAWSLGELLRLLAWLDRDAPAARRPARAGRSRRTAKLP